MSFFDSVFRPLGFESSSKGDAESLKPLTPEFKNRVLQHCGETFPPSRGGLTRPSSSVWAEVHKKFRFQRGVTQLSQATTSGPMEDLLDFLESCEDRDFLKFIEYVCEADDFRRFADEEDFVNAINKFFREDDLPYALTEFQWKKTDGRGGGTTFTLVETPKIIRRDNQVTHESAVEPALQLLQDKQFTSANSEFLEALEDFRERDYGDCLTKACSAMESTMKIICDQKGWSYSSKDTAGQLVQTVVSNSSLDGYFQQPLMIVATLRNRLSKAHGAGTQQKNVPEHLARYAINATAANILLLVEECG